ncbi:MAG: 50S ribosomal protein L23 [Pseudomonadota bacterium]
MQYLNILISPFISDKSVGMNNNRQYVFLVDLRSTKYDVKLAVEKMYNVTVDKVNIINVKGKVKQDRNRRKGKRSNKKKAIVKLNKDNTIDFNNRG